MLDQALTIQDLKRPEERLFTASAPITLSLVVLCGGHEHHGLLKRNVHAWRKSTFHPVLHPLPPSRLSFTTMRSASPLTSHPLLALWSHH